ncbi:50S ribosomal protein L22 [bacterium]|nr:50S ribosomal protein L22 [bacterium]
MSKINHKTVTNTAKPIVGKSLTRFARCSARKVRLVVDLIRNKNAGEALTILAYTQRPSAVPFVLRGLKAAIASAGQNHPEPTNLIVGEAIVNDAPMIKRIRPASMGRAVRVRKRNSHIFLALTEN